MCCFAFCLFLFECKILSQGLKYVALDFELCPLKVNGCQGGSDFHPLKEKVRRCPKNRQKDRTPKSVRACSEVATIVWCCATDLQKVVIAPHVRDLSGSHAGGVPNNLSRHPCRT